VRPSDWSGRWGIDSFVIALLGCDADGAALVAERLRLRVEGAAFATRIGAEIALTVSAGVASTGLAREESAVLVARAFRALDEAKRAGRNRVCVSRPARA
jgi:diguanylate cyclase (GGDEF)-like protein